MEIKKSQNADLESKKGLFLLAGLVIVLAVVLSAFEWTSKGEIDTNLKGIAAEEEFEDEIENTFREEKPPPPPPPEEQIIEIEIVEDDVEVEDDIFLDSESDEDEIVEIVEVVPDDDEDEEPVEFYLIEDKPEFPGGEAKMYKWLAENTKYPSIAKENGISGKVYIEFIVAKNGQITNVKLKRGVDPYLDKEAKRVVTSMPKWKPGKQRGKAVPVHYMIPINFTLSN
jgi:protein TonB